MLSVEQFRRQPDRVENVAELRRVMSGLGIVRWVGPIAVLFSLVSGAEAATLSMSGGMTATLEARDAAAWSKVDASASTLLPTGAAWAAGTSVWQLPSATHSISAAGGDPCRSACSPFYGGVYQKKGPASPSAAGWEATSFWAVFAPQKKNRTHTAELVFTGGQSALSLLWGSPDKTNMIEFFLGGTSVARFLGADLVGLSKDIVKGPGRGAALLSFAGFTFDAVRFTARAKGGSFEFSNLRTAAVSTVPLPAGGVLLLAGLGGLAALRRRKAAAG
jgi:hypothetical protein